MYSKINVKKSSGSPQAKSIEVAIIEVDDVLSWPSRDDKGVLMVGDIVFNPGKSSETIQATSSTMSAPRTSEGDEDQVGFTSLPEFKVPGGALAVEEFIQYYTNRSVIIGFRIGACDGDSPYWKFFGTPCNPLSLLVEGQDDNEAITDMMKFQQFRKSNTVPGRYVGTLSGVSVTGTIAADVANPDVAAGAGEYQLTDGTAAVVPITDLVNAVNGGVYTLLGSGGTNPSTVSGGGIFSLANGVVWTAAAGARLTLKAFEDTPGNIVFFEVSRSA